MNEYRPALDALRERRKGKPGELWLVTGIVLMLAAPFALVIQQNDGDTLSALKAEGRVAEAMVKDKGVRSESYTDRKGRQKSRDLYTLSLQHDLNAELTYAEWKAGKPFARPQYPAMTSTSLDVGESYYGSLSAGTKTTVVRIPTDYKSMMLTEQLKYETSLAYRMWWYLGVAAVFLGGVVMMVLGWRKRKADG